VFIRLERKEVKKFAPTPVATVEKERWNKRRKGLTYLVLNWSPL
jgi:hypothetical protein